MQRRPINAPIRKSDTIAVNEAMRARGVLKQTWMKANGKNMLMHCVIQEIALSRAEWNKNDS